jgi:2,4-dichlorophenol 6-monooxygenase
VAAPNVLIVGAGPTGCTLALLLARAQIPSTLIEQNTEPQQHPAACILNTRTMEVFRQIGIEPQVMSACQNVFDHGRITWVVSLAGRELGQCSALPPDPEHMLSLSPTHTTQFPQHRLEPILWRAVERQPLITFRKGARLISIRQDETCVTAATVDAATGMQSTHSGPYLVAADGASSAVRGAIGIPSDGPIFQHMVGIHFDCDLGHLVNERKSILYWILNRQLMGVLIAHWLPTEWVLFAPYFPPQQKPEEFTEAVCRRLVETACGCSPVDLNVKHIGAWVLGARLARSFSRGRVYLSGDAAHSFPPTGGLGLNTGVQDAHNLAWKLAAVLKARAHPRLLDTYERERRPVAHANLDHSMRNFLNMNALPKIAGLDPAHGAWLKAVQTASAFRWLPMDWQRRLVNDAVSAGLKRLSRLDAEGRDGDERRRRFRALLPGQEPHYRFLGIDLGFAYTDGAIASESTPKPEADNPVVDYRPTTWPGSRMPHCWVRRDAERLSTLDLTDGEQFVVLTHVAGRQYWSDAVTALRTRLSVPIICLALGSGASADVRDEDGAWPRLSEVEDTGAVLVRPDGHVAWRSSRADGDPVAALASAMDHCCALKAV